MIAFAIILPALLVSIVIVTMIERERKLELDRKIKHLDPKPGNFDWYGGYND